MSQREKLVARICRIPTDFTWDEMVRLMESFDYRELPNAGTSHRKFYNEKSSRLISVPKPHHPRPYVGRSYLRAVVDHLNLVKRDP